MATAQNILCEDQLLCSICLDVFNKPVSIPCGHNFCQSCIAEYWDLEVIWQCPLCKNTFESRPDLKVNTLISELAVQFKVSVNVSDARSSPVQPPHSIPGGKVVCDICTGPQLKALKSCLDCLASYCETHLEPHGRVAGLRRHNLIDPVENLEDMICKRHNRLLMLFCQSDCMCLCEVCADSYHSTHTTVPLQEAYRWRKALLGGKGAIMQQMIQERLQKIQEIKHMVKQSQKEAEALVAFIERSQAELTGVIDGKQKATEKEAEEIIKDLEKEISHLKETDTELKHQLHTANNLHLLQNLATQSILPQVKDWSRISVGSYRGMEEMGEYFKSSMSRIGLTLNEFYNNALSEAALERMQQHEVDVILDPDTAHPSLLLSTDGKQVKFSDLVQSHRNTPKMFDMSYAVLGKGGHSSGKFYFEVQVGRKVEWNVGVASESVNRKERCVLSPNSGIWVIAFKVDTYTALTRVPLHWQKVETMGVFVDYEKGQVSFCDVENRALIYSYTGYTFTEKLYPYFNPCDNEYPNNVAPLVISPVNQRE